MFFSLILENANGDRVDMTTTANQYMTAKVEGLNPPPGTISTSSYAGMDGSYLNNAFIEKRNVVIHFEMRGIGVEKRRHQLYKVVKPSRYVKVYYKTAGIDVFTEGYVETCEVNNFEMLTTGQISILCPDIYWYSTTSVIAYYSQITGAFTFPFPTESNPEPFILGKYNTQNMMTIVNDGDKIGFTLVIEALEDARSPTLYNADTDEYLQITGRCQDQYHQPPCFRLDMADAAGGQKPFLPARHRTAKPESHHSPHQCVSGGVVCRLKFTA